MVGTAMRCGVQRTLSISPNACRNQDADLKICEENGHENHQRLFHSNYFTGIVTREPKPTQCIDLARPLDINMKGPTSQHKYKGGNS